MSLVIGTLLVSNEDLQGFIGTLDESTEDLLGLKYGLLNYVTEILRSGKEELFISSNLTRSEERYHTNKGFVLYFWQEKYFLTTNSEKS